MESARQIFSLCGLLGTNINFCKSEHRNLFRSLVVLEDVFVLFVVAHPSVSYEGSV